MHRIVFLDRSTIRSDIMIRQPNFAHEWIEYKKTSADQALDRLAKADIVITNKVPVTAGMIAALPDLQMVAVAATGVDIIDLNACHQRHIIVSNIRNYALTTVAEHVITLILSLRRQMQPYQQAVIDGRWNQKQGFCVFDAPIYDLDGAILGIIGFGALGQATARLAYCLGMNIQYYSRTLKPSDIAKAVDLDTLLETSDVISCHCSLTPDTRHLINADALAKMKTSALLINTARGDIVDEQALANALKSGQITAAGIDVLPQEPPQPDSPMMRLAGQTNVIVTPHIAWASQQAMQALADQLIDNIEGFVEGNPRNTV